MGAGTAIRPGPAKRRGAQRELDSVFEPSSQHRDVDKKIVASLERLSQALRVLLREEAQEHGLSPIQAQILVHLLFHGPGLRRVGQLAKEFDLTRATVSDAVGSLEKKGLVERSPWPGDGRVATLRLSPAGEEAARGLATWANAVEGSLSASSPEEKEVVMRFLMGLIASLQRSGVVTVARMCVSCRFFRPNAHPNEGSPHHCALLDLPLARSDLRVDCPEHERAAG
jgi:DNA-binding MarR family transcriptional regulator